jgi:hypothetical protein
MRIFFFAQQDVEPRQVQFAQPVVAERVGRETEKAFQSLLMICRLIHISPNKKRRNPNRNGSSTGASSSLDSAAYVLNRVNP